MRVLDWVGSQISSHQANNANIYICSHLRVKRRVSNSCNRGFQHPQGFHSVQNPLQWKNTICNSTCTDHLTNTTIRQDSTAVVLPLSLQLPLLLLTLSLSSLLLHYIVHQLLSFLSELSVQFYLLSLQRSEGSNPGWHPLGHVPVTLSHTSPCQQFPHDDMQSKP